jgi:hypothetical protein
MSEKVSLSTKVGHEKPNNWKISWKKLKNPFQLIFIDKQATNRPTFFVRINRHFPQTIPPERASERKHNEWKNFIRKRVEDSTMRFSELLKIAKPRPMAVNETRASLMETVSKFSKEMPMNGSSLARFNFIAKRHDDFHPYLFLQMSHQMGNDVENVFRFYSP